jgi:hypothetical protein
MNFIISSFVYLVSQGFEKKIRRFSCSTIEREKQVIQLIFMESKLKKKVFFSKSSLLIHLTIYFPPVLPHRDESMFFLHLAVHSRNCICAHTRLSSYLLLCMRAESSVVCVCVLCCASTRIMQ